MEGIHPIPPKADLVKAVCYAMQDIGYVRQTGRNTHHNYSYTSEEDLTRAIQPALVKHGLMISPVRVELLCSEPVKDYIRQDILVTYCLSHVGGSYTYIVAAGSGTDKLDKSIYKAMTGAFKYALRQTFAIPSGDDAEACGSSKGAPPVHGTSNSRPQDWLRPVGAALAEYQQLLGASFQDAKAIVKEAGGADRLAEVKDEAIPKVLTRIEFEYAQEDKKHDTPKLGAAKELFA